MVPRPEVGRRQHIDSRGQEKICQAPCPEGTPAVEIVEAVIASLSNRLMRLARHERRVLAASVTRRHSRVTPLVRLQRHDHRGDVHGRIAMAPPDMRRCRFVSDPKMLARFAVIRQHLAILLLFAGIGCDHGPGQCLASCRQSDSRCCHVSTRRPIFDQLLRKMSRICGAGYRSSHATCAHASNVRWRSMQSAIRVVLHVLCLVSRSSFLG